MKIVETSGKSKPTISRDKYEELVKKLRKEHEKPVKGMFEFVDAGAGSFDFCYRFFKEDPIITVHITHGEIVELPMGIVKHINNTRRKIRKFSDVLPDGMKSVPSTYETNSRIRFTPMDVL